MSRWEESTVTIYQENVNRAKIAEELIVKKAEEKRRVAEVKRAKEERRVAELKRAEEVRRAEIIREREKLASIPQKVLDLDPGDMVTLDSMFSYLGHKKVVVVKTRATEPRVKIRDTETGESEWVSSKSILTPKELRQKKVNDAFKFIFGKK